MKFPLLLAFAVACSDYEYVQQPTKQNLSGTTAAPGEDDDSPAQDGDEDDGSDGDASDGDGSGDDGADDGGSDGSDDGGTDGGGTGGDPEAEACDDEFHELTGTWDFETDLHLGDALDSWIGWIAEGSDEACDWTSWGGTLAGAPAWVGDLFCIVDAQLEHMKDIRVEYTAAFVETGTHTWEVREDWRVITFDPDGDAISANMASFDCPMEVEDYDAVYVCDDDISFDEHDISLPINGLVELVLDFAACEAMDHEWGCSWDKALDETCSSLGDWWLELACEELIDDLVLPDPCASPLDVDLSGIATVTWNASGPRMEGVWDAEALGQDVPGTMEGSQR